VKELALDPELEGSEASWRLRRCSRHTDLCGKRHEHGTQRSKALFATGWEISDIWRWLSFRVFRVLVNVASLA